MYRQGGKLCKSASVESFVPFVAVMAGRGVGSEDVSVAGFEDAQDVVQY